jgi:hypothetical protein
MMLAFFMEFTCISTSSQNSLACHSILLFYMKLNSKYNYIFDHIKPYSPIFNVKPVSGWRDRVNVGCIADVSEILTTSIFKAKWPLSGSYFQTQEWVEGKLHRWIFTEIRMHLPDVHSRFKADGRPFRYDPCKLWYTIIVGLAYITLAWIWWYKWISFYVTRTGSKVDAT